MKIRNIMLVTALTFSANALALNPEQISIFKQRAAEENCKLFLKSGLMEVDSPFTDWNPTGNVKGHYKGDLLICNFDGEVREVFEEEVVSTKMKLNLTLDLVSNQTYYVIKD